jgi:hypothetical protein
MIVSVAGGVNLIGKVQETACFGVLALQREAVAGARKPSVWYTTAMPIPEGQPIGVQCGTLFSSTCRPGDIMSKFLWPLLTASVLAISPAHAADTFDCVFKDRKDLSAGMTCKKVSPVQVDGAYFYFLPMDRALAIQSPPLPPDFREALERRMSKPGAIQRPPQ